MKFGFVALSVLALVMPALAAASDDIIGDTDRIPDFWDGLTGQTLHKEMAKPENFPAYLAKPIGGSMKVGHYLVDGKMPTGPIKSQYIEIHDGQSDDVMNWEAHDTSASNVYYHIFRAADYYSWLATAVGEPIYKETKPVVVRVNMAVQWAKWIKFSKIPQYNVSFTFPDADPDKWGTPDEQREIWFNIPMRKLMPPYVVFRYIPGLKNTVLGTQGFPLDSAKVPSIIYHEWTHIMTRPYLGIDEDDPINEGYSDYFGSVIWGRPSMGEGDEFSSFPYLRDLSIEPAPVKTDELTIPSNFVPRYFWSLRRTYGGQRTDVLLWNALKFLTPTTKLMDLPAAILKAAAAGGAFSAKEQADMAAQIKVLFKTPAGRSGD